MILVTGANGQLGVAFRRLLGEDCIGIDIEDLDLCDAVAVGGYLARTRPDAIINCAAYTAVDRAEDEEATAFEVNVVSVETLARDAAARAIPFVTYSTDYVFGGSGTRPYLESDPTAPINAYGRTKRAGEERALAAYPSSLIIRTSWVVSGTHRNFVSAILGKARDGKARVVADQRGLPTIAADLAVATMSAVRAGATGFLHLANEGETTWWEFAREAVRCAGLDPETVEPCRTEDYPTRAARPGYSVLGSERIAALGIPPLPPWRDGLPALVKEMLGWLW